MTFKSDIQKLACGWLPSAVMLFIYQSLFVQIISTNYLNNLVI